jgi:hypothetical protein
VALDVRSAPSLRLYYVEIDEPGDDLQQILRAQALRLGSVLTRAGGSPDGDPLLIRPAPAASWQLALPVRGNPQTSGRYRSRRSDLFHYVGQPYAGDPAQLPAVIAGLQQAARDAGLAPTGELRLLPQAPEDAPSSGLEIQLGVAP